jgi:hypothetical protein
MLRLPIRSLPTFQFGKRFLFTNVKELANVEPTSLRKIDLDQITTRCGARVSGTKSEVLTGLMQHLREMNELAKHPSFHKPILSIDVGYRNIAYVVITPEMKILAWHLTELNVDDTYIPKQFANATRSFIESLPYEHGFATCLIERQRFRSNGIGIIPEPILRGNVVEALLHAFLPLKQVQVESISPTHTKLQFLSAFNAQTNSTKKASAVTLVKALLSRPDLLQCSPVLRTYFMESSKKDDLSDCLLQALAWLQWRKFSVQLARVWEEHLHKKIE